MYLDQAQTKHTYIIEKIHLNGEFLRHLNNLGLKEKTKVALLSINKENGIVLFAKSRLALDRNILAAIEIKEFEEDNETWSSLSEIKVGESAQVVSIHGSGALKQRLMDMGITRGTMLHVRKVAPLGDPIEIHLRGYELTLRNSEAQMILVAKRSE